VYRSLDAERIVTTARTLVRRVEERFPGSGLSRVAGEVLAVAEQAAETSRWLGRPNVPIRSAVVACVVILVGVAVTAVLQLEVELAVRDVSELFQGLEAAINDAVFVAIAIFFLASWESRIKRRRALRALHELRSLAHVVDMHQLTKDPERLVAGGPDTPSSPERTMSPFELTRYLDYCTELLALVAKVGALYVQRFEDPATLSAVNDIENLCSGLSRKIWQKIMILDRIAGGAAQIPSPP
jgi:hypothetical protein